MEKWCVLIVLGILILVSVVFFITNMTGNAITSSISGSNIIFSENTDFTDCLNSRGVKVHIPDKHELADKQKRSFKEFWEHMDIIDCKRCDDIVWVIDKEVYYGFKSLSEISNLSGCEY